MPIYLTNAIEKSGDKEVEAISTSEAAAFAEELSKSKQELALERERRRQAEATLRETEGWFRQLTMNIGKFCWISDPDKKQLIYLSPGYEQVWSRSREMPLASAREWLSSLSIDDLNRPSGNPAGQPGPGKPSEDYQVADSDGSLRWIRNRTFPIYDEAGKIVRLLGIAEDITEVKRLEEALLKSELKSKAFLSVVPDWVVRIRKDGTLLEIHGAKDGEHPLPRNRLIGKKLVDLLPPQIARQAMQSLAETLRSSRKRVYSCQYLLAGQILDFEAHVAMSGTDEVLALIRDVTDRVRLQKEIQENCKAKE
jgi:PAS domain-containing protein